MEPDEGDGTAATVRRDHVEDHGDPVCWLSRVCPECGLLAEGAVPAVCPRCGAAMPESEGGDV